MPNKALQLSLEACHGLCSGKARASCRRATESGC